MNTRTIRFLLAGAVLAAALFVAGCATSPEEVADPTLTIEHEGDAHISPETSPNTQDEFSAPLSATTPEETVIQRFEVRVTDAQGQVVYTFVNETEDGGLFSGPEPVTLPENVLWDGTNESGNDVADGDYTLTASITDDIGQEATAGPIPIVVDNTPPSAELELPYQIFSPDGDGNKDSLFINQSGTAEVRWVGRVLNDDDELVFEEIWQNTAPPDFSWNGREISGAPVPDGTYQYVLRGTDPAGNTTETWVSDIRVNTESYTVGISAAYAAFSPNGDGDRDTLPLEISAPPAIGITRWTLDFIDSEGVVVQSRSGEAAPPQSVTFDGRAGGEPLAEGVYRARLAVTYRNGNRPTATTDALRVDLTPPRASVRANYEIFSPNGDGNKERLTISQETEPAREWTATITPVGETGTVLEESWSGSAPPQFQWAGDAADGQQVPDGAYRYVLQGRDAAGNTVRVSTAAFEKDTSEVPAISLRPELLYFSPNDDGVRDLLELEPGVGTSEGLQRYRFTVLDDDGDAVYEQQAQAPLPEEITWSGTDTEGEPVQNGTYRARLTAVYRNGNEPTVTTGDVRVDRAAPEITVSPSYTWFSPNGDDRRDVVRIEQSSSEEQRWKGVILNENDEVIYSTVWEGSVEDFSWDGRNQDGQLVSDGTYVYRVSSTDRAGNTTTKTVPDLRLDTREPTVYVEAASGGFSPDDDGTQDSIVLDLFAQYPEAIGSWELAIAPAADGANDGGAGVAPAGEPVMTYSGHADDPIPETVSWAGATTDDRTAPEGSYTATLTVSYVKGDRPTARLESSIALDRTDPTLDATVSPRPFTPDDNPGNDTLRIDIEASDNRSIEGWEVRIIDPTGTEFTRLSGSGAPQETITWDGRADDGELVQSAQDYTAEITVRDPFGNSSTVERTVPVGILVVRDQAGDLRIRITSIHFAPFEADYTNLDDPERVEQNKETLDRLAEILKEYANYDIRIEGHAVQIYHYDEELAEQEQEQTLLPLSRERAAVIKGALVERGVAGGRMTTEGVGGAEPIVPHSDRENRWKNRRVQFELVQQES